MGFDPKYRTLNNPFIIKNNFNYYLDRITQKNIVELNEDGTTIKSKSMSIEFIHASLYHHFLD